MVVAAARIEFGAASRTAIARRKIFPDRQLAATNAAQYGSRTPLIARPHSGFMPRERRVAFVAGVVLAAASHLDRDHIARRMPVRAAGRLIDVDATNPRASDREGTLIFVQGFIVIQRLYILSLAF